MARRRGTPADAKGAGSSVEARFFCETGALAGADHRIGGSATIGRGSSNTIVVADGMVSKTHARISFDAAAWPSKTSTA